MEENKKPFRLRMNLFDGIVLVIILAVGLFFVDPSAPKEPASRMGSVRYSVRLSGAGGHQ